jgi:hypothetical protein
VATEFAVRSASRRCRSMKRLIWTADVAEGRGVDAMLDRVAVA